MKSKRLLIGIALIMGLSGCGINKIEDATSDAEITTTDVAEMEQSTTAIMPVENPVAGGSISISMRPPKTLNPLLNEDVTVDKALKLLFEPLFVFNNEQEVVPNLAEGYLSSPDGKTMAITLRTGEKWHDGTEITADDIIFSLDTIKNSSADSVYRGVLKNVSSYSKSSKTTVILNYNTPYGGKEYNLCFPIIPKHYYNGKTGLDSSVNFKPLGNGLFKFDSYRLAREMKLTKTANFKGQPYINEIKAVVMPDSETELSALEQGVIDVLELDLSSWGKFNSATSVSATSVESNQFEFLGFNFNNPSFSNKNTRQAIAYAIPHDDIVNNIYLGNAVESLTPINSSSWLSALTGVDSYDYNLKTASETLANTGLTADNMKFAILVNEGNSERVEIANLIATNLNQIGMSVTVDIQPFEQYKTKLETDQFDMFIGGAELETKLDLSRLLSSSAQTSPGINYFNFSDLQMDNLINACTNAVDEENYKNSIAEVQRYCSRQLPLIGLGFKSSLIVVNDRVEGNILPVPNNIFNNVKDWYVATEENEEVS